MLILEQAIPERPAQRHTDLDTDTARSRESWTALIDQKVFAQALERYDIPVVKTSMLEPWMLCCGDDVDGVPWILAAVLKMWSRVLQIYHCTSATKGVCTIVLRNFHDHVPLDYIFFPSSWYLILRKGKKEKKKTQSATFFPRRTRTSSRLPLGRTSSGCRTWPAWST